MTRLPLKTREDLTEDGRKVFDRVAASRGTPVGNIWRVLLNSPNLTDRVLLLADELRQGTTIDRRDRELAVLAVGLATDCAYEFEHHCHPAVKAGITPEQIKALAEFESSPLFNERDRAVIRFALEATKHGTVPKTVWDSLRRFFDEPHAMEIVMTVAWYNTVVRILLPLEVEIESGFVPVKR